MKTILLVDDELDLLHVLAFMLEFEGYRVLTADGAAAGLAILKNEHVDLVITDFRMPGMDGFEFATRARALFGQQLCFLLMTGFSEPRLGPVGDRCFSRVIAKPFEMDDMRAVIAETMASRPTYELRA